MEEQYIGKWEGRPQDAESGWLRQPELSLRANLGLRASQSVPPCHNL